MAENNMSDENLESSSDQDTPFSEFSDVQSEGFDYIVIGSSFCAFGFVSQMLKKNPSAKILIVERGGYASPNHFDTLPPDDLGKEEKKKEKKPWKFILSENEHTVTEGARGLIYLFGGRSPYWKAWSPEPTRENMTGWPSQAVDKVLEYFPAAAKLLNVVAVDKIGEEVFGSLQDILFEQLQCKYTGTQHAQLAIEENCRNGDYKKYSVLKPLLSILKKNENVKAVLNCTVGKIKYEGNKAVSLEVSLKTSRESISIGQARVILAMSTLPSTTLMLNSFSESNLPSLKKIGKQFTGHFASYTYARIPIPRDLDTSLLQVTPQIAALHIPGKCDQTGHQYHTQLTAIAVGEEIPNNYDIMKNLIKTPKPKMLESCRNHLVLVCATLGQLDHDNSENYFCRNDSDKRDITENTDLHFATNEKDQVLWDTMDHATYEVIKHLSELSPGHSVIEYWNKEEEEWQLQQPEIRWEYLVHPASTMWLGEDDESPVDLKYRFRGVDNVYLTGGALWPTAGSWNPTCTMTAMAMHLAEIMAPNK